MVHFELDFFGSNAVIGTNFEAALDRITEAVVNHNKLHLVADFDHTLTTFCSKQCHDIIAMHEEYPKEFRDEFEDVCKMSFKANEFHLWWRIAHDLIVNRSGLTKDMFQRSLKSAGIKLREGTADLLTYCRDMKIPVIVTSAGITNVITSVLEAHGISSVHDEHFHIDANHMEFHSDDGTLLRILPEIPIHSNAKKYVHKRAPHMFSTVRQNNSDLSSEFIVAESLDMKTLFEREENVLESTNNTDSTGDIVKNKHVECLKNEADSSGQPSSASQQGTAAILLGDKAGDFEVLSHLSELNQASLFRIGFALNNLKAEELLEFKCCDVILIGETHSTDVVLKLMKALTEFSRQKNGT